MRTHLLQVIRVVVVVLHVVLWVPLNTPTLWTVRWLNDGGGGGGGTNMTAN